MAVTALLVFSGCTNDNEINQAYDIIETTGIKGGVVIIIGADDPALITDLRSNDSYLVQALDTDEVKVANAREYIQKKGMYGKVSVDTYNGKNLPYVDNCVNLLVVKGEQLEVSREEVQRVLTPRGVAYINGKKTVKPVPDSIDEWTHSMHGPDNNAVANDMVINSPRRLQWVGHPRWSRHHDKMSSVSAMVTSGGRLFYIIDEGLPASIALPPDWKLVARDAFSGVVLWKRPIKQWHSHLYGLKDLVVGAVPDQGVFASGLRVD